jgi:hypothetical protein
MISDFLGTHTGVARICTHLNALRRDLVRLIAARGCDCCRVTATAQSPCMCHQLCGPSRAHTHSHCPRATGFVPFCPLFLSTLWKHCGCPNRHIFLPKIDVKLKFNDGAMFMCTRQPVATVGLRIEIIVLLTSGVYVHVVARG